MKLPSSAILDVAIGIAFVYLFLSLICSVVNEGIASILSLRSKNLVAGIDSLFSGTKMADGRNLVEVVYAHGLIRGLYKEPEKLDPQQAAAMNMSTVRGQLLSHVPVLNIVDRWFDVNLPAYIPSATFATALIDVISPPDPNRARVLDDVRQAIDKLPPSPTRQALMSLVADTQKDVAEFQHKVEGWFNDSMDRASGWYKKRAQNILLGIALVLTVLLNVDTLKLAQSLWTNPVARQATVQLAQQYVDANKAGLKPPQMPADSSAAIADLTNQAKQITDWTQQLPFPFGWHEKPPMQPLFWLETLTGWLITTLALSLGAPFWFDTLNKFMVVRSTVKPQEKSASEGSKDS